VKSAILSVLPAFALACSSFSAHAAAIEFSPDIQQGFNFQPDAQTTVGFLTSLTFNEYAFVPDFTVASPGGTNISVVGVLSSISWAGSHGDPIVLHAMVSTSSKQTISLFTHQALSTRAVSFNFLVYEYDPLAHVYFEAFSPGQHQSLNGLVGKSGVQNLYSISSSPDTEVVSPVNYEFTITIAPALVAQDVVYRASQTLQVMKQWGIGSPNAPVISGVGTTNLSYHGATMQATVNPGFAATGANFHYGLSPSLSSYATTPINPLGNGGSDLPFSAPISNLQAGTTYYYQAVATNSVGTSSSGIASFDTPAVPSPRINRVNLQGNSLSLTGTNGAMNATFYVLATTNVTTPRSNWLVLATNQFDASGNFNCLLTNAVSPASRAVFYQLRSPAN
jgi:hypothetical protein